MPALARLTEALTAGSATAQTMLEVWQTAEQDAARVFQAATDRAAPNGTEAVWPRAGDAEAAPTAAPPPATTDDLRRMAAQRAVNRLLTQALGREVKAIDGSRPWSTAELHDLEKIIQLFPPAVAKLSVLSSIRRDKFCRGNPKGTAGVFTSYSEDPIYHQSISLSDNAGQSAEIAATYTTNRRNSFATVALHEFTHSLQYTPEGYISPLLQDYAKMAGWDNTFGGWSYQGEVKDLPGGDHPETMYPPADRSNPQEDMAEAVTFYVYAPHRLSPARYQFVKDHIFLGREPKSLGNIPGTDRQAWSLASDPAYDDEE
jgi:hypothetical protein